MSLKKPQNITKMQCNKLSFYPLNLQGNIVYRKPNRMLPQKHSKHLKKDAKYSLTYVKFKRGQASPFITSMMGVTWIENGLVKIS